MGSYEMPSIAIADVFGNFSDIDLAAGTHVLLYGRRWKDIVLRDFSSLGNGDLRLSYAAMKRHMHDEVAIEIIDGEETGAIGGPAALDLYAR
jgi:hypothetical protein